MFLILEFAACFIAVCVVALLALAAVGTAYVLAIISRKSAKALHVAYHTRAQARGTAFRDHGRFPVQVPGDQVICPL
jgi:hypothetical protein